MRPRRAFFLAEPADVFDALWSARAQTEIAGVMVPTPDLAGHALVVGLHALRDPSKPWSKHDLAHLATVLTESLDDAGRAHLADLAAAGSQDSARTMLEAAGLTGLPPTHGSTELSAWQFRQEFGAVSGTLWLLELRRATWRERPRVLAHAILPARRLLLLSSHLAKSATRRDVAVPHGRRWLRALRALPRVVPALRRAQSSGRAQSSTRR